MQKAEFVVSESLPAANRNIMTNEERWTTFIRELREYILEHHHLPDKHKVEHRGLLNQVKYVRKKIKEGK